MWGVSGLDLCHALTTPPHQASRNVQSLELFLHNTLNPGFPFLAAFRSVYRDKRGGAVPMVGWGSGFILPSWQHATLCLSLSLSLSPSLALYVLFVSVCLSQSVSPALCLSSSLSFSPLSLSVDLVPLRHAIGVAQVHEAHLSPTLHFPHS